MDVICMNEGYRTKFLTNNGDTIDRFLGGLIRGIENLGGCRNVGLRDLVDWGDRRVDELGWSS
jgi:hypothetical protein